MSLHIEHPLAAKFGPTLGLALDIRVGGFVLSGRGGGGSMGTGCDCFYHLILCPCPVLASRRCPCWTWQSLASWWTSCCWSSICRPRPCAQRRCIFRSTLCHPSRCFCHQVQWSVSKGKIYVKWSRVSARSLERAPNFPIQNTRQAHLIVVDLESICDIPHTWTSMSRKPPSATSNIRLILVPDVTLSKKHSSAWASMCMMYPSTEHNSSTSHAVPNNVW